MSITGGIKFFSDSLCLAVNGATAVASSGDASSANVLDKNRDSFWTSVGSNDATAETLTITFASVSISRLLLLDFNWKNYSVQYWNGSAWTNFAGVIDPNHSSPGSSIAETLGEDSAYYFEFTPVTTTKIRCTVNTTQTTNAEKYIAAVIVCTEYGTFSGFPMIESVAPNKNARMNKMLSGRMKVVKSIETIEIDLRFDSYPTSYSEYRADVDLLMSLFDLSTPFLIWLCGGRRGSGYFNYTLRGFRMKDVYRVQMDPVLDMNYLDNCYKNPIAFSVKFLEHV